MPLQAVIGQRWFSDHMSEVPHIFFALWSIGTVSLLITSVFFFRRAFEDHKATRQSLEDEGRILPALDTLQVRVICFLPLYLCFFASTCLFYPALYYTLDMAMTIGAAVVIWTLMQYYICLLGEPPAPERHLKALGCRRWWSGVACGGFSDPLCCLGWCRGHEPSPISLQELRMAVNMVWSWIFIFLLTSAIRFSDTLIPAPVIQQPDGYCTVVSRLSGTAQSLLGLASFLASLVGMSGFTMLAGVVSLAIHGEEYKHGGRFNAKSKGMWPQFYFILPILHDVFKRNTYEFKTPTASIPVNSNTFIQNATLTQHSTWTTVGEAFDCPIFDKEVMGTMFYCTAVAACMALLSWSNWHHYRPSQMTKACTLTFHAGDTVGLACVASGRMNEVVEGSQAQSAGVMVSMRSNAYSSVHSDNHMSGNYAVTFEDALSSDASVSEEEDNISSGGSSGSSASGSSGEDAWYIFKLL